MLKVIEDAAGANGGLVELGRKLGVRHQSFYSWTQVPAERVLRFEELSGVSRHRLRPDIYGPAPKKAPKQERVA